MGRFLPALLVFLLAALPEGAMAACSAKTFEGEGYTVCTFDLRKEKLALYNLDPSGVPYGSFSSLAGALAGEGKTLAFAMNAGMFDENLKPVGLYVEGGKQAKKLNRREGPGNFQMKPNGVFFIEGGRAGVLETESYARAGLAPDYATQSGPMLVIDGQLHPKFATNGTSLKRRNGVGVIDDYTVAFAISEGAVNFAAFARLFRDGLNARNALFLDGSVSSLYAPELGRSDGFFPLGPIVAVVK